MKALVTGAAGFIGSHLATALARRAAPTSSASTASPTTTRATIKEAQPRGAARAGRDFTFVEAALQTAPLDAAARRRHARLPPGRAGRRAQELGRRLPRPTRRTTSTRRSGCSRPSRTGRSHRFVYASSSSVYGDVAADSDARGRATSSRSRRTASPSWRPSTSATSTTSNYGVPTVSLRYLHGLRPAAAARHGVPPVHPGGARRAQPITLYGDGEQTRDFTFVADIVAADDGGRRPRAARRRL